MLVGFWFRKKKTGLEGYDLQDVGMTANFHDSYGSFPVMEQVFHQQKAHSFQPQCVPQDQLHERLVTVAPPEHPTIAKEPELVR